MVWPPIRQGDLQFVGQTVRSFQWHIVGEPVDVNCSRDRRYATSSYAVTRPLKTQSDLIAGSDRSTSRSQGLLMAWSHLQAEQDRSTLCAPRKQFHDHHSFACSDSDLDDSVVWICDPCGRQDDIRIVSLSPPSNKPLQTGASVLFEINVEYNITSADYRQVRIGIWRGGDGEPGEVLSRWTQVFRRAATCWPSNAS